MTHRQPRVFPYAPLALALMGRNPVRALRVSTKTLAEYRRFGLNAEQADRLACRIGKHPAEVWGQEWFAADDLEEAL